MYRIKSDKEALAVQLFLKGYSGRMVAADVGIDKNTAWTIGKRVKALSGTIHCPCGKVAGHKEWCGHRAARFGVPWRGQWKDISQLNIYVPSRPRYDRPDIPNERETEIALLVNLRGVRSLDAPMFDGDEFGHTYFKSEAQTPLEILLHKEEANTPEYRSRQRRIDEYLNFLERKKSAHAETILDDNSTTYWKNAQAWRLPKV